MVDLPISSEQGMIKVKYFMSKHGQLTDCKFTKIFNI